MSHPLMIGDDWELLLVLDGNKLPKGILANVVAILQHSPAWAGAIAFDESRGEIVMANPAPAIAVPTGATWRMRVWTDADDTAAAVWLQRQWRLRVSPDTVAQAVGLIASARRINPLTAYLRELRWDGVPRLETWLTTYCGAEDSAYTRAIGATWLRGTVGRALRPGIKLDGALIFEGHQGKGKSSVLGILGGEWFTDDVRELDSKDAAQAIGRAWIVELAELSALGRSELEATKAFITRKVDRYRPPYGRRVIEAPRRCAFAGSTNRDVYLNDGTGNRRFWPVKILRADLEGLAADRDQLLAEAVATWGGGDVALPPDVWGAAAEQQEARYQADAWEDLVATYLIGRDATTVGDVLIDVLNLDKARWSRADQMRVASALGRLGWERKRRREGDLLVWRYLPPPPQPPPKTPPDPNGSGGLGTGWEQERQPKGAGVPNDPNVPISGAAKLSESSFSNSREEVGNVGINGNNKEKRPFPTCSQPAPNLLQAWDNRYAHHLATRPGDLTRALDLTTGELGPRPAEEAPSC